jgi:hypothetical protein
MADTAAHLMDHVLPNVSGRYTSVRCFVRKLRGHGAPDAHSVIITAPGE